MIIAAYAIAGILMAAGSLYLAWRSIDFRKFLAGAFSSRPESWLISLWPTSPYRFSAPASSKRPRSAPRGLSFTSRSF